MKIRNLDSYKSRIKTILEDAGRYTAALDLQVSTLASALRTVDIANDEIDGLESTTVKTPQGLKAHPVFRIKKEAEDSAGRLMKALGLTAEALQGEVESDPLLDVTREVLAAGKRNKPVRPKKGL